MEVFVVVHILGRKRDCSIYARISWRKIEKTNAIIKEGSVHVIDSHGIDVLPQVFDTVTDGKVQRYVAGNKTVILEKDGYEAVLSLDEHGKTKTWLLSGWKISTGETSEVSATSGPTQDRPTFSRSEWGAVLDTMSMTQPYKNVNSQISK